MRTSELVAKTHVQANQLVVRTRWMARSRIPAGLLGLVSRDTTAVT
jgi:hypothetical protein